jgi:hypothetical protein
LARIASVPIPAAICTVSIGDTNLATQGTIHDKSGRQSCAMQTKARREGDPAGLWKADKKLSDV